MPACFSHLIVKTSITAVGGSRATIAAFEAAVAVGAFEDYFDHCYYFTS